MTTEIAIEKLKEARDLLQYEDEEVVVAVDKIIDILLRKYSEEGE
jgi:hypothetical protein